MKRYMLHIDYVCTETGHRCPGHHCDVIVMAASLVDAVKIGTTDNPFFDSECVITYMSGGAVE